MNNKNEVNIPAWTLQLLAWYDVHKRALPWRESKDPYRIWVSEIMSQQTRIEAMRPYYEQWMRQFPTMEDLAAADEDTVVRAWQGLGYYSRARNLRLGVQEVVNKYGGQVPRDRKAMESLRGVGAYTAGAVLSIAFNQREPAVDGNVLRVYARLYDIHDDILKTAGRKQIEALVSETMPYDRPGDFNEALMDFGASVCIPKVPRCEVCPLANMCRALAAGTAKDLPVRIKNTKVPTIPLWVGLFSYKGYYLLHRRPNRGLLRSMWEFPTVELAPLPEPKKNDEHISRKEEILFSDIVTNDAFEVKKKPGGKRRTSAILPKPNAYDRRHVYEEGVAAIQSELAALGLSVVIKEEKVTELVHVFSHRRWIMDVYEGTLESIQAEVKESDSNKVVDDSKVRSEGKGKNALPTLPEGWCWLRKEEFATLPWAGPHGKLTVFCQS